MEFITATKITFLNLKCNFILIGPEIVVSKKKMTLQSFDELLVCKALKMVFNYNNYMVCVRLYPKIAWRPLC